MQTVHVFFFHFFEKTVVGRRFPFLLSQKDNGNDDGFVFFLAKIARVASFARSERTPFFDAKTTATGTTTVEKRRLRVVF